MINPYSFYSGRAKLYHADCRDVLKILPDNSIDSIVTDPPYSLVSIVKRFGKSGSKPAGAAHAGGAYMRSGSGFMGKSWDTGETAFSIEFWEEIFRVLKPGGYVLSFGGTRSQHRLVCAIEDAGFEIRDQIGWCFGSGFPKSHAQTVQGQSGWGSALKPAWEPICVARKPIIGTIAENITAYGTGAINIDGCRIKSSELNPSILRRQKPDNSIGLRLAAESHDLGQMGKRGSQERFQEFRPSETLGRWPANLIHDGSPEVLSMFPKTNGTGAINIDGCRVPIENHGLSRDGEVSANQRYTNQGSTNFAATPGPRGGSSEGRWPANLIHDGSPEVLSMFPETKGHPSSIIHTKAKINLSKGKEKERTGVLINIDHGGSAARYFNSFPVTDADRLFYHSKTNKTDRAGSLHPTVKPMALMQHLCRLVTPPNGLVLDPFAGSGSTLYAALAENFRVIGIEREDEYAQHIIKRLKAGQPKEEPGLFDPPEVEEGYDLFDDPNDLDPFA